MKKFIQTILALIGVGAIYKGWDSLQTEMPKPTEDQEFTRIDYLSGDYKDALDRRERELEESEKKGKWYLAAGAALLAGGVTLLAEAIIESSEGDPADSESLENNHANGTKRPTKNGDPVPGAST